MIRVLCTTTLQLWFIPSLSWALTSQRLLLQWATVCSRGLWKAYWAIAHNQHVTLSLSLPWKTHCSHKKTKRGIRYWSAIWHFETQGIRKIFQTNSHGAFLVSVSTIQWSNCTPAIPPPAKLSCHKRQVIRLLGQGCVEGMRVQVSRCPWGLWRKA